MVSRGTTWPWDVSPRFIEGSETVESSMDLALLTPIYARKMNNKFGSQLNSVVFENEGPVLDALVRREIGLAIQSHVPSVTVSQVDILYPDPDKVSQPIKITLIYEFEGEKYEKSIDV